MWVTEKGIWSQRRGYVMTINDFAVKVALLEGKKKQMNIAQIKEVIKVIRKILLADAKIDLYKIIRERA